MADQGVTRKLAAIFYADVAGYSRLTGADEEGTHRLVSAYLDALTDSIQSHNGTALHFAGDAILAEFPTVSDALICAVNIQNDLKERNADLPDDRKVQFRIGVNLGEVIVDRGEIFGNGVNVAARLESLAEPGGICVSAAVRDAVGSKLPLDYEDMGEQSVKNIAEPVRAFAVRLKPDAVMPPPGTPKFGKSGWSTRKRVTVAAAIFLLVVAGGLVATKTRLFEWFAPKTPPVVAEAEPESTPPVCATLEDKPKIAVLPFSNLSNDPKQKYLSDGISEDIITRLARRPDMVVTARTSSSALEDKSLTVPEIGRKLGVHYVLEGSVQKAGDRIRITAQLIEAKTGNHLWAERYDREINNVFAVQDEIAHKVAVELAVKLTKGEVARIIFKSTDNFTAYDYYLRGMEAFDHGSKKGAKRAEELFQKAIEIDPQYAQAIAFLGQTIRRRVIQPSWGYDREKSIKRAEELANRALAIDANLPDAKAVLGNIYLLKREHDKAIASYNDVVKSEPSNPRWYVGLARMSLYAGRLSDATEIIARAKCLGPYPLNGLLSAEAFTHYLSGRYEEAIRVSRNLLDRKSRVFPSRQRIIASYMALGHEDEARAEAKIHNEEYMKLRGRPYKLARRLKTLKSRPYKDPSWIDVYAARLIKAGIPE